MKVKISSALALFLYATIANTLIASDWIVDDNVQLQEAEFVLLRNTIDLSSLNLANSSTWHGPLEIAADCTIKNGTIRNNSLTGDALVTITGGNVVFEDVTFDCSNCAPEALVRIAFGSKANVTFKGNCRFLAANKNVDAIYIDYCTSGKVTFDSSFTGYVGGKVTLAYESTHPNDDPAVEVSIAGSGTFENAIALDGGKYAFSNSSVLISGGKFAVAPKVSNVEFGYSSAKDGSGYWAVNARGNILSPDANKEIGYALGLPELDWKAVGDWQVQTTNTIDGMGVEIPVGTSGKEALLAVEINGPAFLAFRYRPVGYELFEVFEDGVSIWKYNAGWDYDWQEAVLDIPDGMHTIMFNVKTAAYSYYGNAGLDDFRIYNVRQPVIKPAAGKSSEDACGFVDEQMIEIESSEPDIQLYYTLDGSDPSGANAILYDGPFFINDSTVVKTVALSPDKGFSMVSTGCFAERSCPVAGRWTRYGDGAIEAAKINGRMVFFLSRMSWCYYGEQIYTAALSETFADWASANGIYMVDVIQDNVTADSESVYKRVWPLWEQLDEYDGYMRSPFSVFTSGLDANTAIGAMVGYTTTTGKRFSETPESLIVCLGSYLGMERLLAAPIASVTDASDRTFPCSVTLSNTNGTGTIYYTLDGTAPTRDNGIRYTAPITIPSSGTTLKAVVWPNDLKAVSGIPLSITYESFADAIGAKGVVWQNDAARPWSLSRTSSDVVVSRGKDENLSSGTSQSTLRAVVDGPGTFHFGGWFDPMNGTLEFRKDGETLRSWHLYSYNFETNVVVSASGKTTFEWVYVSSYYDIAYSNNNPRCELKGISWMPMKAPSAPEDFAVSQGVHEYGTLLRWTAQEGHVSYSIYRGESNSFPDAALIGRTEKNLYWDVECEAGKIYWYWVKAINDHGESGLSSAVSGWRPVVYSVSYDANGGGGYMAPQRSAAGESITIPENGFAFAGHIFIGWATRPDGAAVYETGDSLVPTSDMILFAVWKAKVNVAFDANGGELEIENGMYIPGTTIGTLPWPQKESCRFAGWFTAVEGGDKVDESWIVPDTGATLYAHWKEPLYWHTDAASALAEAKSAGKLILFVSDFEFEDGYVDVRDYVCELPEVQDVLEGYVLWFSDSYTQNDLWRYVSGSGSVSLPFVCVINPYTNVPLAKSQGDLDADDILTLLDEAGPAPMMHVVTFNANGGEIGETERKVQLGGTVGALPMPLWNGYKFVGWFTEEDGGTKVTATTKVTGDVTYYAHWEYDGSAMVTVKVADGCEAMGKAMGGNATFKVGAKVSLKATASKGYVFAGWWCVDGDAAVSSKPPYLSQSASFTYIATGEPVTIVAVFATIAQDTMSLKIDVEDAVTASDGTCLLDLGACVESLSQPKLAVSGLPSGLKFDAKTMTISGKATKPGVYKVTVSATNATVKKPVTAEFEIVVPNLASEVLPGLEQDRDAYGVVMCGVAFDPGLVNCSPESGWTVKAAGLPSGLKYDAKTGKITGVATKAGTYTVTFTATRGKEKEVATITLNVEALPTWATGTFAGNVTGTRDARPYHGSATMTVAANGKVSGKIALEGTNWTFSAASFSRVESDPSSEVGSPKSYFIEAVAKAGKATRDLVLEVAACDGGHAGRVTLPNGVAEGAFGEGEVKMWRNMWKDKSTAAEAKAEIARFEGVYTVSIADGADYGSGYLSLTVGKNGDVKATGKLADGTSVSATSPLMYDEEEGWFVMLYAAPSACKGGAFAAAVGFDEAVAGRLASVIFQPQWTSRNPQATGEYGEGFEREVDLAGAYYNKLETLRKYYESLRLDLVGAPELSFTYKETSFNELGKKATVSYFSTESAVDTLSQPGLTATVNEKGAIVVAKATKPVLNRETKEWSYNGPNDGGLTLSFTQATGIFKGSYTFWYDYVSAYDETTDKETLAHTSKKVNFEGILVQGEEPKMEGFYLWDATGEYEDPKTGKSKVYKYKQSFPVSLQP